MATIETRQNDDGTTTYRVKVRLHGFPPVSESFPRKKDAKQWGERTEADMRAGRYFPERAAAKRTFGEVVDRYVRDVCPHKKDGAKQARQLEVWRERFGRMALVDVTGEAIARAKDELAAEDAGRGETGKRTGATVNRYLAVLSHLFTKASREWGMVKDNPVRRVTRLPESKGVVRYLDDRERERLLRACAEGPGWLRAAVVLALATAMRQGEILGLRWRDVDLERRRLVLHDTKNGERRGVPLAPKAVEVLRELGKVRDLADDTVFPPYHMLRKEWDRAVVRAKLEDFRFHDLRHTAASYLAMNGATPSEIAAVTGHKTLAMVKRYAHLSDEHVAGVVDKMAGRYLGEG